jgi:glutaredoxin-related protein
MDIIYYSNYCKHSQKIIQYLVKNRLNDKLNFICIDKRKRDPKTNQLQIILENGSIVGLPPNIQSVPALLLVKQNYQVILGDDIIKLFEKTVDNNNEVSTQYNGEPRGFVLAGSTNGMNIVSEQYTFYDMSPDELSAKGKGGMRNMHNYVNANHEYGIINTPNDDYKPDKLSNSVTVDTLQQKRNDEIPQPKPFVI